MVTICNLCLGPIVPPDTHLFCIACLGLAHAESALKDGYVPMSSQGQAGCSLRSSGDWAHCRHRATGGAPQPRSRDTASDRLGSEWARSAPDLAASELPQVVGQGRSGRPREALVGGVPIYDIRNVLFLAFQGTEVTKVTGDVFLRPENSRPTNRLRAGWEP
ncbi:hypothetical protein F2P79_008750 [Pimephales promelas]|nr:hypothetical protein F2P79_008750 [Pimephales promelas]